MARSLKKGPYIKERILNKAHKMHSAEKKSPIKLWQRAMTIIPDCVGLTFQVYNGKKFIPVRVNEDMVGHKFGEYVPTRNFYGHAADKKVKK